MQERIQCYCLNPRCPQPLNLAKALKCKSCGASLLVRDRYRAFKRIGQGGFGATFLVKDQDLPSHPWCVIKQLQPPVASPRIAQFSLNLFNREAKVLEKLGQHSQIPTLFAHFQEANRYYLVQEFIEGETLAQELQLKGPMTETEVKQVLQDILLILNYVHSHHTVHRDIKPTNLIRRQSDQRLVLIDFGAVTEFRSGSNLTCEPPIRSVGYSPPEQMAGQTSGPASDIYALGATSLYLLTGKSPTTYYDPDLKIWTWSHQLQLSAEFELILLKMLSVNLEDRYSTAHEVLKALCEPKLALPSPLIEPSIPRWQVDTSGASILPKMVKRHPLNQKLDQKRMTTGEHQIPTLPDRSRSRPIEWWFSIHFKTLVGLCVGLGTFAGSSLLGFWIVRLLQGPLWLSMMMGGMSALLNALALKTWSKPRKNQQGR